MNQVQPKDLRTWIAKFLFSPNVKPLTSKKLGSELKVYSEIVLYVPSFLHLSVVTGPYSEMSNKKLLISNELRDSPEAVDWHIQHGASGWSGLQQNIDK